MMVDHVGALPPQALRFVEAFKSLKFQALFFVTCGMTHWLGQSTGKYCFKTAMLGVSYRLSRIISMSFHQFPLEKSKKIPENT